MPIQLGDFELDEVRLELRRCGTLVNAQPRAVETLLYLVTNHDRLVTKEEILARLWKGTPVSGAALSQVIHQLRAALEDDPKAPRFIETVRGKGFRFLGELTEALSSRDSSPPSSRLRPLFGRQLETERLQLAASEGRAGHGNVVLIHGPPGVGKTRLAQWFATHQREAGAEVCWGGCREGQSAPPFWPWPEVLHRYTETRDRAAIELLADGLEQDLVAVAPELRETLTVGPASAPDESYGRAQSVLESIATFLRRAASRTPLTLVLEDLHLADDAALHLFEAIARSIADTELMILGTCRRTEGSARGALRTALEQPLSNLLPLPLDGLSLGDVRTWLSTVSTTPLPDPAVEAVHFSTGGLPLLLEALVHELPNEGATLRTWDGNQAVSLRGRTKDILGRLLHQLDDRTLQLLRTAAVFGEEFPTALLAAVTSEPLDTLLPRLDSAQEHGVLKPAAEGSLRFAHALHQELLYYELSALERHEQHAAFARALADRLAQDPDAIVQTAHHFLEALPHTHPSDAVHYARKAAEWARARHAYARAAQYYQRALDVLDTGNADPRQYAELLLALGQTQCVAGSVDDAIATLERVFELTRAHCHYDLFCRAILVWFQLRQDTAAIDPIFHARIAEALQNVREKDAVFAELQVARAMSQMFTSPMSERILWIQEALALTRETANSRTRLDVLRAAQRCHTRFTDGTTELGVAQELLQLAIALRSPEAELEARQSRANTLLEFGRGIEFAHEVTACRQRAMDVRTPQAEWTAGALQVGQLFLAGSLGECERIARDISKMGQDLMGVGGFLFMLTQLFQIGMEGEADEAHRILDEVATGGDRVLALAPSMQALMLMVARARMYCDQPDAAREYLARVTTSEYVAPDPLDRNFLTAMVCAADLACFQNDATAATVVSQLLDPYVGWHAVAAFGSVYLGPVTYWLGRLSLVCNRTEDAQRQLHLAIEHSESAGSVIYRAWSEYHLAQALPANQFARREALLEHAQSAARDYSLGRLRSALGRSH